MLRSKLSKAIFVSFLLLFIAGPAVCFLQTQNAFPSNMESTVPYTATVFTEKVPLNRNAVRFVNSYIKNNQEDLIAIKKRSKAPFQIMDAVFKAAHLPVELKYLSVIESELKPTALSPVGAVGPWQLMPETARLLGLKVGAGYDERKQFRKSTKAAAVYLQDLYGQFGDWLLVMAAYNGGPGSVYKAIHKSGSRNFWKLQCYLPAESRKHVKRFIATEYYFEGHGSLTTLTKEEAIAFTKSKEKFLAAHKASKPVPATAFTSIEALELFDNNKSVAGSF